MAATGGSWSKTDGGKSVFTPSAESVRKKEFKSQLHKLGVESRQKRRTENRLAEVARQKLGEAHRAAKRLKNSSERSLSKNAQKFRAKARSARIATSMYKDAMSSSGKYKPMPAPKPTSAKSVAAPTKVKSTGKKASTAKKKSTGGGAKKARSRNSKA